MTRRAEARPAADGGLAFVRDNLEAIAVAIVMALIIKHFCVEAFKIPTSSMEPTLLGDREEDDGDRILVDKWSYLVTDPQRWDVIVFRYPLNRARNFIKRIAFLPREHGHISDDGDLWVRAANDDLGDDDLRIATKPRRVREQFYRAVYPPPLDMRSETEPGDKDEDPDNPFERSTRVRVADCWRLDEGPPNAWRLEDHEHFAYVGGEAASLRNARPILEHTTARSWGTGGNAGKMVRDVRFRLRVEPAAATEGADAAPSRLTLRWRPDARYLAVLTLHDEPGRSEAFIRRDDEVVQRIAIDARLRPGQPLDVEFEYVDGRLYVRVDDRDVAELEDGRRFHETREGAGEQRFQFEAEGRPLAIRALRTDRDLRYENSWDGNAASRREGIDVPAQSYFMLGDHTTNSSDSRRWRLTTVHLTGGKKSIAYDAGTSPDYPRGQDIAGRQRTRKQVVDADGLLQTWYEEDEDSELGHDYDAAPFVHRELIVGRAFVVFWPWSPTFPGRMGFIH
ncbi:MAG: signal peptidase I [Planctomycetota bacterium]|nr:signal peptidase I [Planctomycetota bacterium]